MIAQWLFKRFTVYVLQPYQLVKDLRTEAEDTNPQNVLNGDLDLFLGAALSKKVLD